MSDQVDIHVGLIEEGHIVASRPAPAERISKYVFRLIGPLVDDEVWEFQPGDFVRCEDRVFTDGSRGWLAVAKIPISD